MPTDIYKLHQLVRSKDKDKENGFLTFVRGRRIFTRPKATDKPTLINAETDLHNFLESLESQRTILIHPN